VTTQKHPLSAAPAALRDSDIDYRSLFEGTATALAAADIASGRLLRVNHRICELLGYTVDELLGMTFEEITHPDERAHNCLAIAQIRRGEQHDFRIEKRYVRKDGTAVWVDVTVSSIRDVTGAATRLLASAIDVTERKRAEAALRASEEFNRTVIESSPDCVKVLDHSGVLLRMNSVGVCLLEIDDISAYIGKPWWTLWPMDQRAQVQDVVARVSRGELVRFEGRCPTGKGTLKWWDVSVAPVPGEQGAVERMVVVSRDVTVRKQAEESLRASEARFRSVVEHAPNAMVMVNSAGTILMVNGQTERLFGYAPGELIGQPVEVLVPERFRDVHPSHRAAFLFDAHARPMGAGRDLFGRRKDGTEVPIEIGLNPIVTAEGNAVLASIIDITVRKTIEQALRDSDRRKDEFLATLAHELRNPLAPVRNAVQILHMKAPDPPELQWATQVIDRQIQTMTRLIDDLMDVSRISRGKLEIKPEPFELAAVINHAVEAVGPLIAKQEHQLTVSLSPDPILVDADLIRLSQVFSNLLGNAAKYTERGGRIELRAEPQAGVVAVSIKDTGIGISAEHLPNIFELFSQVESALQRSEGGMGIGLSLTKRLVAMHGGTIEAKSEGLGKGSEFVVRLPTVHAAQSTSNASDATDTATPRNPELRILVVDDNRDAAASLAMLLDMLGNRIRVAHDGKEAVRAAAEFKPHAVLLDIGLPEMNGHDVARHIRAEPWGKAMILIAVSGWGQDEDKRQSAEAGFDRHLVKPVDPQVLIKLLSELGAKV
jgi:PAS domain S-box-containing protein